MATLQGITKSGYLEIKQSSKVRGRKLKTWKRKWVSVHQMSDLSTGTFTAKVNVYDNEETAKRSPSDKITFLLENATKVRSAKSKTHPFAFEVVEAEPVLVFSGENDSESFDWMTVFKRILWPQKEGSELDMFDVSVQSNDHSMRLGLSGSYKLSVTPNGIALHNAKGSEVVQWQLSSLKKFYLDNEPNANQKKVLVIDSGPVSDTGEGSFRFLSDDAEIILKYIGQCIKVVIAQKQQLRQQQTEQARNRAVSFTRSEYKYQAILESSRSSLSESDNSSLSSTPPKSPLTIPTSPQCSPIYPSCPPFPAHNTVFRSQSKDETGNQRCKPCTVPYTRHSSESSIVTTTEASVFTSQTKPRTQSFTTEQPQQSLSLCDSGIILQDGEGKQQVERIRRKSSEVRHGSNSFDSAVSSGSYTEEIHVSPAIHEEPITFATNRSQTLPNYSTAPMSVPSNSQHTQFTAYPTTSNSQPTQFVSYPTTQATLTPNSPTSQFTGFPTTQAPLTQNSPNPQFTGFPTTQGPLTQNSPNPQFTVFPTTQGPLTQNSPTSQFTAYPTTQGPLTPTSPTSQFTAFPNTQAVLTQNSPNPQFTSYPTTEGPLTPTSPTSQFTAFPNTQAVLTQNCPNPQFTGFPTTQAPLTQNSPNPHIPGYPTQTPLPQNGQSTQFTANSGVQNQPSPPLSAAVGSHQKGQTQFDKHIKQETIDSQSLAAMPSRSVRSKEVQNYSNVPADIIPALPPRKKTPPAQNNRDVNCERRAETHSLPPSRKKTPPAQCQNKAPEITSDSKPTVSKSVEDIPEKTASVDADPPSNPIYQSIDDEQMVRSHSTGDIPKENEYEELKLIGKKKKDSKKKTTKSKETPPELPIRPATLRYRPKRKNEEVKRRSALANLFSSSEKSHSHSSNLNDLKEASMSDDTLDDSNECLSRSSSKDIYSSISSDIDSQASDRLELHLHPDVFNMTLVVEPEPKEDESKATETKGKADAIIDLFPPTVCNWIKSGGQTAASHVNDLMGLDIPENITGNVATPILSPSAKQSNLSPVNMAIPIGNMAIPSGNIAIPIGNTAVATGNMANPKPNIANPTASVTDWAIISGSQVTSDASIGPFFSESKKKENKWANFDDFDPFFSCFDDKNDQIAEPVVPPESESMYIDMTSARSSNRSGSEGDSIKTEMGNDTTPVSDDVTPISDVAALAGTSTGTASASTTVGGASASTTAGTTEESPYVVPDELT